MKTRMVKVAVLELVSGALCLILTVPFLLAPDALLRFEDLWFPFSVLLACNILPVAGGIAALRGKAWGLAFVGALFSPMLFLGIGVITTLINSRDDWSRQKRKWTDRFSLFIYAVVCLILLLSLVELASKILGWQAL